MTKHFHITRVQRKRLARYDRLCTIFETLCPHISPDASTGYAARPDKGRYWITQGDHIWIVPQRAYSLLRRILRLRPRI